MRVFALHQRNTTSMYSAPGRRRLPALRQFMAVRTTEIEPDAVRSGLLDHRETAFQRLDVDQQRRQRDRRTSTRRTLQVDRRLRGR